MEASLRRLRTERIDLYQMHWPAEDGTPLEEYWQVFTDLKREGKILAEQRLGHDIPGMRGLYAHASQRMREELTASLQARWEESLRERADIHPHSPVSLLDNLLAPHRAAFTGPADRGSQPGSPIRNADVEARPSGRPQSADY